MPACTQWPLAAEEADGAHSGPLSPGPPPLEFDPENGEEQQGHHQQIRVDDEDEHFDAHAFGRPQRAILRPAGAPLPSSAVPSVPSGRGVPSSLLAPAASADDMKDDDEDISEESKDDEKRPQHGVRVPRRLRPFYQHQWLDVLDTQDTWLEAQVVAVDPVEASEAAERELAALIADRRRGGAAQLNAPPSAAAAAPAASSSPAPPAQFGPQARRIRVHYKSFHSKYDEWLDVSSDQARDVVSRIALLHTHTRIPHPIRYPRPFKAVGDAVDCKDTINAWHAAHVVAFHDARQQVLVHYDHFDSRFDEWIDLDSYRLQPVGTFVQAAVAPASQARSAAQQRQAQLAHSHSHLAVASAAATSGACTPAQVAQFTATAANELRFRELLRSRLQSDIVDQKEDGNCLFRSVSHQVYGEARHHRLVRSACMSYIEGEKGFFAHFIAGESFEEYVARMRLDGQWGDNVELQAMSEIYERPIEIYAYSHVPLKTFMASASSSNAAQSAASAATSSSSSVPATGARPPAPPIRLSYHFASHYNSVVYRAASRQRAQLCTLPPGQMEQAALERADQLRRMQEQQRAAIQAASAAAAAIPAGPLSACRSHFRSALHPGSGGADPSASWLDAGAAASLSELDAVFAAEVATAQESSAREAAESEMLRAAMEQSERDEVDQAIERAAMEEARRQRQRDADNAAERASAAPAAAGGAVPAPTASPVGSGGGSNVEEAVLARALAESRAAAPPGIALSEEEQLAQALRLSSEQAPSGGFSSDDAELQAALRASRADAPSSPLQQQGLPAAVSACVELGFPLEMCVQAYHLCGGEEVPGHPSSPAAQQQLVQRMMDFMCGN